MCVFATIRLLLLNQNRRRSDWLLGVLRIRENRFVFYEPITFQTEKSAIRIRTDHRWLGGKADDSMTIDCGVKKKEKTFLLDLWFGRFKAFKL